MDTRSGQVIALDPDRVETWTLDLCTNSWTHRSPVNGPEIDPNGRAFHHLTFDSDAGLAVLFSGGGFNAVWTYSPDQDRWRQLDRPAGKGPAALAWIMGGLRDSVYDPVSGDIIVFDQSSGALWAYDVATNTWDPLEAANPEVSAGNYSLLALDSTRRQLVLLRGGSQTWTYDLRAGSWTERTPGAPFRHLGFWESGGEIVYDAARDVTLVLRDGLLAGYDADADRWDRIALPRNVLRATGEEPVGAAARLNHWMMYDPTNERVVVLGGLERRNPELRPRAADDVWAYDAGTNGWLNLVPSRSDR